MRKKITVIGAGNVGASVAQYCLIKKVGDVVMLDIAEGVAKGKALDLAQTAALQNHTNRIIGSADYADSANSDVVIVTAGIARKPGMSRDDLVKTNMKIVSECVKSAVQHSPNCVLIIVSNPLDIMCKVALDVSGLPTSRVLGFSGLLDGSRLKYYLSEAIGNTAPSAIDCLILGEHGDSMVPITRTATVNGVAVSNFLSKEQMDDAAQKAANGGAAVVALLGSSAYYGPGIGSATMAEAVVTDSHSILCCSCYMDGQYGAKDMFMCVPARIGSQGVEQIIEVNLDAEEKAAVAKSIASIKSKLEVLKEM